MAGAGKSSIGQKLAKRLDFNFIDSDLAIERKYSKNLGLHLWCMDND